jgi:hypothetical protein
MKRISSGWDEYFGQIQGEDDVVLYGHEILALILGCNTLDELQLGDDGFWYWKDGTIVTFKEDS